jgi:hypothetical protein
LTVSEFKPSYCPSTECESNGVVYKTKSEKCVFCGTILEHAKGMSKLMREKIY